MSEVRKRRPTYTDVARRAGVSPTTVSFVINGKMDVSIPEKTRARVMRAAKEIGYRPNRLARGIVQGRTQSVGFLFGRLSSTVVASILEGAQDACDEFNQRLLLAQTKNDQEIEAQQIERLLENRIDGILAVVNEATLPHLTSWLAEVNKQEVPVVLVDDDSMLEHVDCFVSDDAAGLLAAVAEVKKKGHSRIAYVYSGELLSSSRNRLEGYHGAMAAAELTVDPALVVQISARGELTGPILKRWAELDSPPTVIIAESDSLAGRIILDRAGVEKSHSYQPALISIGHPTIGEYFGLSTISQDPVQIGYVAMSRLLERIGDADLKPERFSLPTNFVARPPLV